MGTIKDASAILRILAEDNTSNSTLENIASQFHQSCNKNGSDQMQIGILLTTLLDQPEMLPRVQQRITAFYLLYEMFRGVRGSPFAEVFAHFRNVRAVDVAEISFLSQLISHSITSTSHTLKKTPKQLATISNSAGSQPPLDCSHLNTLLAEKQSEMPSVTRSTQSVLLPDPMYDGGEGIFKVLESCLPSLGETFEPYFLRIPPPLYMASDEELVWMNPLDGDHRMTIDTSAAVEECDESNAKSLLDLAIHQGLTPKQQEILLTELKEYQPLNAITSRQLPDLVENNPLIAIEVLMRLLTNPDKMGEYLKELVNMDMSVHSMEVVNRLTSAVELPPEFIQLYIANCIQTCEGIKDKYMQNRLVRLLCVFLQSLIRNGIVNVKDLFIEVQAFCINFSRIREAAALFRLLKTIDTGAAHLPTPESNNGSSVEDNKSDSFKMV